MHAARCLLCALVLAAGSLVVAAQNDLDAFMAQVLERRDDNWKKLQQYILDERETTEIRGSGRTLIWGEQRDYTWFIRDGLFIRSPVKVNGAAVGENDRKNYEDRFFRRQQRREANARNGADDRGPAVSPPSAADAPADMNALIRQTQQPEFISSAYFLRFKFDEGRYALVGRERLEDRDVLRIEYYPTKLFSMENSREQERDSGRRPREDRRSPEERAEQDRYADAYMRLMNRTSKVTLWVEPASHQILKYTFDDLNWNFFPRPWLVRVTDATASMTVGQMFPDVWLPRGLDMHVRFTLATGPVEFNYRLEYLDYRQADVTTKIGVPGGR